METLNKAKRNVALNMPKEGRKQTWDNRIANEIIEGAEAYELKRLAETKRIHTRLVEHETMGYSVIERVNTGDLCFWQQITPYYMRKGMLLNRCAKRGITIDKDETLNK